MPRPWFGKADSATVRYYSGEFGKYLFDIRDMMESCHTKHAVDTGIRQVYLLNPGLRNHLTTL